MAKRRKVRHASQIAGTAKRTTPAPTRIAALVEAMNELFRLVQECDVAGGGTTLKGTDRKSLLRNATMEADERMDALAAALSICEPETADDAFAIVCLLSHEFDGYAQSDRGAHEEDHHERAQRRKVARMIAGLGQWLEHHAGARCPLADAYLSSHRQSWAEEAAEARQEARMARTVAAQTMVARPAEEELEDLPARERASRLPKLPATRVA